MSATATAGRRVLGAHVEDWRRTPERQLIPLMVAEADRWRTTFDWDVTPAWRAIAAARTAGTLPGLAAFDEAGQPVGWTCFVTHCGTMQVPILSAAGDEQAADLIDAILATRQARDADACALFAPVIACDPSGALRARRFAVTSYRYLSCPLTADDLQPPTCEPWPAGSEDRLADLCGRAYAESRDVRVFAPNGTHDEWRDYAVGLIAGPGCGRFLPGASWVIRTGADAALAGAVIVTDLGRTTAHVAQVAVAPGSRGRGFGRRLVEAAMTAAAQAGFENMSLLVAETNRGAAALYERLGFRDRARFVAALRRR